jgi:hypothetical protein
MSSDERQLAIQVIGFMVEALADENGNIDQKCFEKVFNACVKSVIISARVGDHALMAMKQALSQVAQKTTPLSNTFIETLKIKIIRNVLEGGLATNRAFQ